jgi:hypothetical protein
MAHEYSHFVNIRELEMSFSIGETRTKTAKRFIVRHGSRGVNLSLTVTPEKPKE